MTDPANTCTHKPFHDLVQDKPFGPSCGKPATQRIFWKDGRYSPACEEHGLKALDADTCLLVERVAPIPHKKGEQ